MAKWFAPRGGGYTGGDKPVPHGPPPKTPATGGSGYGAGHAPDGLRPPPANVTRPALTLREENLIWRYQTEKMTFADMTEWTQAVSKMLWGIRADQGVELELPASTHVPYLDN